MTDLKSYHPPKTLWRQSWEVIGAAVVIILFVVCGLFYIANIGGPAIDAEDQATRAIEQPIAKELAKKMKGKYYE